MKAAVIIPPFEDFYFTGHRFSVLGAKAAAEIIESEGKIGTEIINFPLMEKKQKALPEYLGYLKKHIPGGETGSCSFFSVFRRYGPSAEKCCRILEQLKPDYIFFSLFAYCYAGPAVELAGLLKKNMPEVKLVAGGAGVSVYPDYFKPFFDAVLPGEGEIVLKEYIRGISRRKGNDLTGDGGCSEERQTSENFLQQMPDRDGGLQKLSGCHNNSSCKDTGFTNSGHTKEGDFSLSVNTAGSDKYSVNVSALLSRGCTKRCRFCSNFITHGRDFRKTPVNYVKTGLEDKKDLFKPHCGKKFFINFEDDNLLIDKRYFFEIIDIFTSFFIQFTNNENIFFSAENGLDYNLLTKDLCAELIDRNFRQFNFTLGSVSSDVINGEKRSGNSRHLSQLLKYINSRSAAAVSYFIAGLKNDTAGKVIDSLLFISENPGISGISMFYSVPGLPDFQENDFFKDIPPGLLRGSSAYPWNNSLTTDELITAFRLSRTVNLFKKENPDKTDKELIQMIKKEKKLFTAVKRNGKKEIVRVPTVEREMEELFFSRFFTISKYS